MAAAGANIEKLVADNERYAKAEAYATDLLRAGQSAAWHTAQYRPIKCAARRMATYDVDASSQGGAELHHLVRASPLPGLDDILVNPRAGLGVLCPRFPTHEGSYGHVEMWCCGSVHAALLQPSGVADLGSKRESSAAALCCACLVCKTGSFGTLRTRAATARGSGRLWEVPL